MPAQLQGGRCAKTPATIHGSDLHGPSRDPLSTPSEWGILSISSKWDKSLLESRYDGVFYFLFACLACVRNIRKSLLSVVEPVSAHTGEECSHPSPTPVAASRLQQHPHLPQELSFKSCKRDSQKEIASPLETTVEYGTVVSSAWKPRYQLTMCV